MIMSNDSQLKNLVLDELLWDTRLDEAHIGVVAEDGAITLTGHVKNYSEKHAAKVAVGRVRGVKSIADDLKVDFRNAKRKDDSEIAKRIAHVLQWNVSIPDNDVKAVVSDGFVTLTGTVDHFDQREHIEGQVRHVGGVVGFINKIELRSIPSGRQVRSDIEKALQQHTQSEMRNLMVNVKGHTVTLEGQSNTMYERDLIHKAAWATPGVQAVINNINIQPNP
jgi:osmotically-inducible protein OsmY